MVPCSKLSRRLSFGEEVANSATHIAGAALILGLLPFTAVRAYRFYGERAALGMSVFVISLFLMFLSSAVYHAMAYASPQKYVLRIIDHSMIYIAIAGSYMPLALCVTGGRTGFAIMLLQWLLTIFGILYHIFSKKFSRAFSLALYLAMGWLAVFLLPSICGRTGPLFRLLLLSGGLLYTLGAFFYTRKRAYMHTVWHLCILAASLLHFAAIVFFML